MKYSIEEKAMWLEDWKGSGKKAWTYAKENGLIPQTFSSWVSRKGQSASGFVEVPVCKKPKPELWREIIIEKGDIKIHIPLSVWIENPGAVVAGLRAMA